MKEERSRHDDREQQKKDRCSKVWRFSLLTVAVLSGGWLLLRELMIGVGLLLEKLNISFTPAEAVSIGVIGGADGPTAIMVSAMVVRGQGFDWEAAILAVIFALSAAGYLWMRKYRRK